MRTLVLTGPGGGGSSTLAAAVAAFDPSLIPRGPVDACAAVHNMQAPPRG